MSNNRQATPPPAGGQASSGDWFFDGMKPMFPGAFQANGLPTATQAQGSPPIPPSASSTPATPVQSVQPYTQGDYNPAAFPQSFPTSPQTPQVPHQSTGYDWQNAGSGHMGGLPGRPSPLDRMQQAMQHYGFGGAQGYSPWSQPQGNSHQWAPAPGTGWQGPRPTQQPEGGGAANNSAQGPASPSAFPIQQMMNSPMGAQLSAALARFRGGSNG